MKTLPIFLSVVISVRNEGAKLESILSESIGVLKDLVADYELIVVDNASDDDSIAVLKRLTDDAGLPNLQIYGLTKQVDVDTAAWVGLENALGDFVAVLDPMMDDIGFLPRMLDPATGGYDVVFASNLERPREAWAFRFAYWVFNLIYRYLNGLHLAREAPQYRVLSKRVVNFLLQYPQPAVIYRHLPATGGFARCNLTYRARPRGRRVRRLTESLDRGMQLLVSNTRTPMRLVTALSLFGAISNLVYSVYVVGVGIFKSDVAPGWLSLSLQQSGMFFLISLVLMVLGEYILHMASLSNEGPLYHVGQEFTSARLGAREKLNVEGFAPRAPEPS